MKTYRINEIFYSIQGEGARAGEASLFLRFSGCNLQCKRETHGFDCDTEWASGRDMTADEIMEALRKAGRLCRWVICTGGEPLLQLDGDLLRTLALGYKVALETNGTKAIPPGIDHVAMSPKVAEHAVVPVAVDELRYVRGVGQGIPKPKAKARHHFISPAFDGNMPDPAAVAWCINLVLENPSWKLSVQQHKLWNIR